MTAPQRSTVAVARVTDYDADRVRRALEREFSLLGDNGESIEISRGDRVLIKPNLICPRPAWQAVQTDPAVILALAEMIKDLGGKPFVGDSPAWGTTAACIGALGISEELKRLGVAVVNLDRAVRCSVAGPGKISVGISGAALDADKIINLPKFKTHQQLVATFAVKNMFGCVCGKEKALWHFARGRNSGNFCRMLIGIYERLAPVVTIIDGVVAMEGPGPINGKARPLGFIIAGKEPVACEAVCCALVNLKPCDLPMIRTAEKIGFGCADMERINVAGDDYAEFVCRDFDIPPQIPLSFSFAQVCKSIGKQLVLLARGGGGN